MKRNTKKGFTLVELVIVIAVIAILAGVLIPTFSNVVANANKAAAEQNAINKWKECYVLDMADGNLDGQGVSDTNYQVANGVATYTFKESDDCTITYNGTTLSHSKTH